MSQTVYTVGNPITSRIKLGVTPDVSTIVTLQVLRPDGTAIATPAISAWSGDGGDEKAAQWYATNDGQSGGLVDLADGDWVAIWSVTGTGAVVAAKVFNVVPLPAAGARPEWLPFLSQVAGHVPWLTVDQVTVGSDLYLNTFNGNTQPTDETAQQHIDQAATPVVAIITSLPARLIPFARAVVALRAAASIARAFPNRFDNALAIAAALDKQATSDYKILTEQLEDEGVVPGEAGKPWWSFPTPVAYPGDHNL